MLVLRRFSLFLPLSLALLFLIAGTPAKGQAPVPPPPGAVVRRIVMKDAASAEQFKAKLEALKQNGLFRDRLPGGTPQQPVIVEIAFLTSGNYLLVVGAREWVDTNIDTIRLMAFLFERPRAHLQLSLRVVQLTGPANADVIQMSETVRALVDAQREEVVRSFADLDAYLTERTLERSGTERTAIDSVRELLPSLGKGERPMTVPEILMLLMLDRSSPTPAGPRPRSEEEAEAEHDTERALLDLPRALGLRLRDPRAAEEPNLQSVAAELAAWRKAVTTARDWVAHYANVLKKKDAGAVNTFQQALEQPGHGLPRWLVRRLRRSLGLTERLYPSLVRRHTEESLRELERRFTDALERADGIEKALARGEAPPEKRRGREQNAAAAPAAPPGRQTRALLALKSLAEELVPPPLALFESVAAAADNAAPTPAQVVGMIRDYAAERRKLDGRIAAEEIQKAPEVNYARLQALESALNLWLRRVSESMARALEQHFYSRYVNELRLVANRQLGKGSSRDILEEAGIDDVPDVARDILLADTGVNVYVSNSISLQFSPDTTNSVSAQVQASLPSKTSLLERAQQAAQAANAMNVLNQQFGISGEAIVKALLAGGQAIPVQGGINLTATPSIGFDASTVSLSLTANQTLQPNSEKVADRVTNHTINNATVTALSYEPMVLSTLASNISYYEKSGGIPVLRRTPIIRGLLRDIPFAPFRETKRQKGVYNSSVLILEPVVIPTIEDLVRYHAGWREM